MSRRIRGQSVVTFGLSFLDVLCCGLGAAVLLLLIVKHGETTADAEDPGLLVEAITAIQEQIAIKKEEKTELERVADTVSSEIASASQRGDAQSTIADIQAQRLASLLSELQQQRTALRSAQSELGRAAAELQHSQTEGEEEPTRQQLTGLMVNNDLVLVLLDASASMLATNLVEIIRMRASPPTVQAQSEKWRSAAGAALWVINSMPEGGSYQVLTFSDTISDTRGRRVSMNLPPDWEKKGDPNFSAATLESNLRRKLPAGPTDLHTALEIAGKIKPAPQQIMLITDGLPTKPGKTRLSRIKRCPPDRSNQTPLVSPICRQEIFNHAVRQHKRKIERIRLDVILLKLEGDSNAVYNYWTLSSSHGGRLLTPVPGWLAS